MKEQIKEILTLLKDTDYALSKKYNSKLLKSFQLIEREIGFVDFIKRRPAISVQTSVGDDKTKIPWILLSDLRVIRAVERIGYCVLFFPPRVNGFYITFCRGIEAFDPISLENAAINNILTTTNSVKSKSFKLVNFGFKLNDEIDFQLTEDQPQIHKESIIAYKFYESIAVPDDDVLIKDIIAVIETYEDFFAVKSENPIKFYVDVLGVNYYPRIQLYKDNWDDFTFKTSYKTVKYFPNKEIKIDLGDIKVLQKEQRETHLPQYFQSLESDFCSLGQDIEYYKIIASFNDSIYSQILSSLNDVVLNPDIVDEFTGSEPNGFSTSLLRFSEAEKAYREAATLFNQNDNSIPEKKYDFTFSTLIEGAEIEHVIDFDFNDDGTQLHRINVLIGKNATGKTQVLARFANAMSGWIKDVGTFSPVRPGFSKVIAVSYSIFDQFERPKEDETFSYKYCGLRNNQQINKNNEERIAEDSNINNEINKDKNNYDDPLLTWSEIQQKLRSSLIQIEKDARGEQWSLVINELFQTSITANDLRHIILENSKKTGLPKLSSGQYILTLILTEIIASISEESIILFDEPEMHLHPDALTALARAFHLLLKTFNSYAIIATHSPIILQEIPSKRVRVLERTDNRTSVDTLGIECFGENLTTITDEVFKTSPTDNNYFRYFENLSERYSYEEILGLFNNKLSFNANAYLTYLFSKKS